MSNICIAIHGGAGTILKTDLTPELEKLYKDGLQEALDKGYEILHQNGTAVNAVKAAVTALENNILFNAGKGSVFTKNGQHEMDAAIMNGSNLAAGSVAGIKNIANPIQVAHAVMTHSDHVLLCSDGANEFAQKQGFKKENDNYFFSQQRYNQWQAMRDSDEYALDHNAPVNQALNEKKFGTVGAVACDANGNIAAATSTGGMTNKKYGRVGDSPIIGAGTYANNLTCAISCTGHGEPFIKAVAAYDVSCQMEYKQASLQYAMQQTVHQKLVSLQGEGGMIGVDAQGNYALDFNSEGMYRGVKNNKGINEVLIYK